MMCKDCVNYDPEHLIYCKAKQNKLLREIRDKCDKFQLRIKKRSE